MSAPSYSRPPATVRRLIAGAALITCASASLSACRRPAANGWQLDPEQADAGFLLTPASMPTPVMMRQRVTAIWPIGERAFDAVLQRRDDTLEIIGVSPIGAPGFVVTQRGTEVTVVNNTARELPFPPEFIVADVQKVFFDWCEEAENGRYISRLTAGGTYWTTCVVDDGRLEVSERFRLGALDQRKFRSLVPTPDGSPAPVTRVTYSGHFSERSGAEGTFDGLPAYERAVLINDTHGYMLTVETSDVTPL